MTTYLTIITTILVLTQIIRVTQNQISLHRQNTLYKKQVEELLEMEIRKEDFEMQRKAYRLIVEKLEGEILAQDWSVEDEWYRKSNRSIKILQA